MNRYEKAAVVTVCIFICALVTLAAFVMTCFD